MNASIPPSWMHVCDPLKLGYSCKRKWSNNNKSIPVEHLEGIIVVLMMTPISEHIEDSFNTWKVSISEQQQVEESLVPSVKMQWSLLFPSAPPNIVDHTHAPTREEWVHSFAYFQPVSSSYHRRFQLSSHCSYIPRPFIDKWIDKRGDDKRGIFPKKKSGFTLVLCYETSFMSLSWDIKCAPITCF
jgi:hypothetical protein